MSGSKIGVLHLGSPAGMYGAERWILALVTYLPTDQVRSVVGVIVDQSNIDQAELTLQARTAGFDAVQFRSIGRMSWSAFIQLRCYIKMHNIHIVHTHGYKTDVIGVLATIGTSCKLVSTPHGWSTNAGLKLQLYEWLDRFSFYWADRVVPLSKDIYNGLARWPGIRAKLQLIPNGVDLLELDGNSVLDSEVPSATERGRLNIGYIGQLIARKSVRTLIQAFDEMSGKDVALFIVGDGAQRGELEEFAQSLDSADRVHFLGFRRDRIAILKMLDIFVLPSYLEGIPRCLLEAMAAGVTVVATNIPGCTDLVDDESTGRLFSCGDAVALGGILTELAEDIDARNRLGDAGRSFVRLNYSAETMAESYLQLYETLTSRSHGLRLDRQGPTQDAGKG